MSWDARAAAPSGFSSPYAKRKRLELRATADAVLAEANGDNLDRPDPDLRAGPLRIVLGRSDAPDSAPTLFFPSSTDLRTLLSTLAREHGVRRLLCEGGPALLRALLEADLVDEIALTFCPFVLGGGAAPTLTGPPGAFLPVTRECRLEAMETVEGECFARYRVIR